MLILRILPRKMCQISMEPAKCHEDFNTKFLWFLSFIHSCNKTFCGIEIFYHRCIRTNHDIEANIPLAIFLLYNLNKNAIVLSV